MMQTTGVHGVTGDPEAVRRAARHARQLAHQLRDDAAETGRLAGVRWVSTEAERWRHELHDTAAGLHADATAVEALADRLLAHADACERTLTRIAAARTAFTAQVDEARRVLGRAADEVSDAALASARAVVDRARSAPGTWSLDWLRF